MFKNYIKTAWRNIKRNKGLFLLNFTGLFISLVVSILIGLIILYEISFDKNDSALTIYRVVKQKTNASAKEYESITQYPLAKAMRAQMPDEKFISQIHFHTDALINVNNVKFKESNIVFADAVFPKLFPLTVKKGKIGQVLSQPGFVMLTETTAKKYFGSVDPIGKRIKIENQLEVEVSAVIADARANSHLPYNMIISYPSFTSAFINGISVDNWGVNISGFTYIGLHDNKKKKGVESTLSSIADRNINAAKDGSTTTFSLQPLSEIHYDQLYAGENPTYTINYDYLYLIAAIGLFLILAACINYTNLATAFAIKKSKETGIRKTMGATRSQLIGQFLAETFLTTGLVIVVAGMATYFLIPTLNSFLEKTIPQSLLNGQTVVFLLLLWISISMLSGIYPALVLSGFNPINALKNKFSNPKTSTVFLRRGLVIFQFVTAQILIIGALIVYKQMNFIHSKPLGFTKERVVDIGMPENTPDQMAVLRNKMASIPGIGDVSFSLGAPVSNNGFNTGFNLKEKYSSGNIKVNLKIADRFYLDTYGLTLLAGRWLDEADEKISGSAIPDSMKQYAYVINETAAKALGFSDIHSVIGKMVTTGLNNSSGPVVGVVKDFHTESLHAPVLPVAMLIYQGFFYNAGIKLLPGYNASTIGSIEKAWSSVYPNYIFETNFLDEHVAGLYKDEQRNQQIFNLFTLISIFINALGLVGLLSFMIEQKSKEIGIRKVLGASIGNISFILSKDFLRLITIAFLIAAPLGWFLMNKWLQEFSYRTEISLWIFLVSIVTALLLTSIAVGFQTIKAAMVNPIKSLRTE